MVAVNLAPAVAYRRELGWDVRPAYYVGLSAETGEIRCSCFGAQDCPTPGKHPIGKWKDTMPYTPDELAQLYTVKYPRANTCLLTGQRPNSVGVVVADIDPRHDGKLETLWDMGWPQDTCIVRTGGGGWHVYAQCPDGGLPSLAAYATGIELKGDGTLVVMPPSIHTSANTYEWDEGHDPWTLPLAPLSDAVLADIRTRTANRSTFSGDTDPNRDDPNALAYDRDTTQRIATALFNKALRKAHAGEGRNNSVFWLSRQLDSLGMTQAEVVEWAVAFAREVKHV